MFSSLVRRGTQLKLKIPFLKHLHLNFILIHYIYIILWAIVGSIVVYPRGDIAYIDALFFAAGAATQSGLNTVDFNKLHTYQQVFLYFSSMCTTPIFIHTCLVFVRLYWFEKRFQHVVQDAREIRRTRSRARTLTDGKTDQDHDKEEMGIGGRPIVVLRNDEGEAQGDQLSHRVVKTADGFNSPPESRSDDNGNSSRNSEDREVGMNGGIGLGLGNLRVPTQLSPEHHIAFLENQRKNKGALRIPSPREYDRGGVPEALEEDENEMKRTETSQSERARRPRTANSEELDEISPLDNADQHHIRINEPDLSRTKTKVTTFPRMDTRPTFRETRENDPAPLNRTWTRRGTFNNVFRSLTQERDRTTLPYLSWNATVGRNSNFVDLTEEQRDELGGIEYRALKTLAVVLISYYVFFHLLGIIGLVPWIMTTRWGSVVTSIGQGRPWWGIFMAGSAFNDVGFSITPDSMNSFQTAVWPLLLMTFLIIIGNTGFPCMLRLIIWVASKLAPKGSSFWEELKFLLDHPRRCFTLLFPRNATWWLFATLVLLNGIDLIFFIILDLNDPTVTALPPGIRVLDGLFQAACTRTAGFGVVSLSDLHPAIQVSYLIMMYISVFPIAISMRRTNVYEEKSLGVYSTGEDEVSDETKNAPTYIGTHLRRQLSFDLWYVFLGLFIITIVEGHRLESKDDYSFQIFSVLFEVVSAYGTVGLSMGYPGVNASFSSQFKTLSKLVIIAMQLRGRHRGLPYSLDRAILLPSESLNQKEAEDAEKRMRRRTSNLSQMSGLARSQSRPEAGASTGLETQESDAQSPHMNGNPFFRRHSTLRSQRSQR